MEVEGGVVRGDSAGSLGSRSSIRGLADKHGVHRRTVRQALASAVPPPRKSALRVAPWLGPYTAAIDEMLRSDLDAPKKQRHTARRVLARLVDEHGRRGCRIRRCVITSASAARRSWLRRAVRWSWGSCPQTYGEPGAQAEVDFTICGWPWPGSRPRPRYFTMRLSHSGRAAHRARSPPGRRRSGRPRVRL